MSENNGHKAGLRHALDAVRALHPRDEESPLDSEYGKGFAKGYNRALDDARSRIESVLRGES